MIKIELTRNFYGIKKFTVSLPKTSLHLTYKEEMLQDPNFDISMDIAETLKADMELFFNEINIRKLLLDAE